MSFLEDIADRIPVWEEFHHQMEDINRGSVEELRETTSRYDLPPEVDLSKAVEREPLVMTEDDFQDAGITAQAMEVVTLEDGSEVYLTHVSDIKKDEFGFVPPEHEKRTMFGYFALKALKNNYNQFESVKVPVHEKIGTIGYAVEGIEGEPAKKSENVSAKNYRKIIGANFLAGNGDLHSDNLFVGDNGSVYSIDLDRSGQNFFGRPEYPDIPRTPMEENFETTEAFENALDEYYKEISELQDEGLVNEYYEPVVEDKSEKVANAIQSAHRGAQAINDNVGNVRAFWQTLRSVMGESLMRTDVEEVVSEVPDEYKNMDLTDYKENFRKNLENAKEFEFNDPDLTPRRY